MDIDVEEFYREQDEIMFLDADNEADSVLNTPGIPSMPTYLPREGIQESHFSSVIPYRESQVQGTSGLSHTLQPNQPVVAYSPVPPEIPNTIDVLTKNSKTHPNATVGNSDSASMSPSPTKGSTKAINNAETHGDVRSERTSLPTFSSALHRTSRIKPLNSPSSNSIQVQTYAASAKRKASVSSPEDPPAAKRAKSSANITVFSNNMDIDSVSTRSSISSRRSPRPKASIVGMAAPATAFNKERGEDSDSSIEEITSFDVSIIHKTNPPKPKPAAKSKLLVKSKTRGLKPVSLARKPGPSVRELPQASPINNSFSLPKTALNVDAAQTGSSLLQKMQSNFALVKEASLSAQSKLKLRPDTVKPAISSKRPVASASASTRGKGKAPAKPNPEKMSRSDCASYWKDYWTEYYAAREKTPSSYTLLKDCKIFYVDCRTSSFVGEKVNKKYQLISKLGAEVMTKYDNDTVTHIIMDDNATEGNVRAETGLKSSRDIKNTVPTLTWEWMVKALLGRPPPPEFYFHYAKLASRIDVGAQKPAPRGQRNLHIEPGNLPRRNEHDSESESEERITSFSKYFSIGEEASSSFINGQLNIGGSKTDPLARYYDRAMFDTHAARIDGGDHNADESDNEPPSSPIPTSKRKYTCDQPPNPPNHGPNAKIADILEELNNIHKAKSDPEDKFRIFSYNKSIRSIRAYPKRITNYEEARQVPNVGDKTARKIEEIIRTGHLLRIQYEKTEGFESLQLFAGIYGVGGMTARKWVANGCKTLEDLLAGKGGVTLSSAQKIGIQFYADINSRMPRDEAREIFDLIKPVALSIDPNLFVEIMGSYRRGKSDCGDIDILITRNPKDGRTHAGVLVSLLKALHSKGIITEDLAVPEDPYDLEAIYRGLCRVPHKDGSHRRRIDFLTVPWKFRGAALLYYTGDDIFNRAMRYKAGDMGYSLNQRGLWAGVIRDPTNRSVKLDRGHIIASETEEEIFKILNVPWQEPHERVRGLQK